MTPPVEQTLIGESPVFVEMLERVSQLAQVNRPVLLIGERGTGKELIARRLHYLSPRWEKPFVRLDCASLAESLLESELFGHEAGAFTGAVRRRHGRFELADHGSLFLDELANTTSAVQEKLLGVIEYGRFERVGGQQTVEIDVRVIGATNVDLPSRAAAGRFRADLLDRLAFDVVTLPPLRARREDILPLAEHFAMRLTSELGREWFAGFSAQARSQLHDHPWPGNVRELKNTVERAVFHQSDSKRPIAEIDFDPFASPWRPAPESSAGNPAPAALPPLPIDLKSDLAARESRLLERALDQARHNQRKAAELLGLTYDQFRGIWRKYRDGGGERE